MEEIEALFTQMSSSNPQTSPQLSECVNNLFFLLNRESNKFRLNFPPTKRMSRKVNSLWMPPPPTHSSGKNLNVSVLLITNVVEFQSSVLSSYSFFPRSSDNVLENENRPESWEACWLVGFVLESWMNCERPRETPGKDGWLGWEGG